MSSDDGKSPGFDRLGRAVSSKPATMRTGIATARRLGVTVLTAEHAWAAVPGANVRLIRRRTLPFVTDPKRPAWHALAACRGVGPGCSSPSPTAATTSSGSIAPAARSVRSALGTGAPRSTAAYANRFVPPSSAGKHVRFGVNPWLLCPGRAEVSSGAGAESPQRTTDCGCAPATCSSTSSRPSAPWPSPPQTPARPWAGCRPRAS